MTSGWPKSALAPICALVASFLLVFLLGAALKKEPAQPPASPSKSAPHQATTSTVPAPQLVIITGKPDPARSDQDPATGVEAVNIWQEDPQKATYKVCLTLKQGLKPGWLVTSPKTTHKDAKDSNSPSCTDPVDGQSIKFVLGRGE
jgi:hypothetical protein